jgi:hypothetical protein
MVAVIVTIACFGSSRIRAQTGVDACEAPRLHVEGAIGGRWVEPVSRLCGELATRPDLDHSAQLRLTAADRDEVEVHVALADGRTADRRVRDPEALRWTIEALLALPVPATEGTPPGPSPAATEPQPATPPAAIVPPPTAASPSRSVESQVAPEPHVERMHVEISAAVMGRIARAPTYLSGAFALYAGVLANDWWIGLAVRWEPGQSLEQGKRPPDFEMDSVAAGFLFARRIVPEPISLSLGMSALLAAVIQSSDRGFEDIHTAADVRLGAVCRLLLGEAPWRWAISLDADISPLRVRRELHLAQDLPALPAWSAGLGLGGSWEDR